MSPNLEVEISRRFGLVPNFFRSTADDPLLTSMLWGFVQFAYLDNPLPSRFKDRLFVYLSRFCEIRYCIARHVGFLVGSNSPAGEYNRSPQTVAAVLPLLRRPLPRGDELLPSLAICASANDRFWSDAEPDSPEEQALFACTTHVFLQTPEAPKAHKALLKALGPRVESLHLFLAFVRMAHYWTKLHPNMLFEDDVVRLLATNAALAECILNDPAAEVDTLSIQVKEELTSLRGLRSQNETITRAYDELRVEHGHVVRNLSKAEAHLRDLISVMPSAIYSCDRDGNFTYYNEKAVELWGRAPAAEDPPWSFLESCRLLNPDETPVPKDEFPTKKVIATGVPALNNEFVLERPDATRLNILTSIMPLRSENMIVGAVAVLQDVTAFKRVHLEREALMKELERSNSELSVFSHAVAHDLLAPVRGVRAFTELLSRSGPASERASEFLAQIQRSVEDMTDLINALLRYAQVGQGQTNRELVQVNGVLERVALTLEPVIRTTEARLVYRSLPVVEADPVLLQQLFQNLVSNAIRYRSPNRPPVVEITGEKTAEGWVFAVKDNGQGIPKEYHS